MIASAASNKRYRILRAYLISLAARLNPHLNDNCCWGLWEKTLTRDLLWACDYDGESVVRWGGICRARWVIRGGTRWIMFEKGEVDLRGSGDEEEMKGGEGRLEKNVRRGI
jgi:hypothetical protein